MISAGMSGFISAYRAIQADPIGSDTGHKRNTTAACQGQCCSEEKQGTYHGYIYSQGSVMAYGMGVEF
jgi:hypothetical protein